MTTVAVVDYGMGNLRSVSQAVQAAAVDTGYQVLVTANPDQVRAAERVVLPGQGAMPACMRELRESGLQASVLEAAANKPLFGICVGMQMLLDHSAEGDTPGLGLIHGEVRKFALAGVMSSAFLLLLDALVFRDGGRPEVALPTWLPRVALGLTGVIALAFFAMAQARKVELQRPQVLGMLLAFALCAGGGLAAATAGRNCQNAKMARHVGTSRALPNAYGEALMAEKRRCARVACNVAASCPTTRPTS